MIVFVAIVYGVALIVHAFLDLHGNKVSVKRVSFLNLLQEVVWPLLHKLGNCLAFWWMQDGAPPHCTNEALAFLNDNLECRVISWRTDHPWPTKSPDLRCIPGSAAFSFLHFHFWAVPRVMLIKRNLTQSTHSSTA